MHAALRFAALALLACTPAACERPLQAPVERGGCHHLVQAEGAEPRFNRLPGSYQSLEYCAAALEAVRQQGGRGEIAGSYQGQFIFINRRGIYTAAAYEAPRYLALVRTGDGRLAMPGAVRRP